MKTRQTCGYPYSRDSVGRYESRSTDVLTNPQSLETSTAFAGRIGSELSEPVLKSSPLREPPHTSCGGRRACRTHGALRWRGKVEENALLPRSRGLGLLIATGGHRSASPSGEPSETGQRLELIDQ